MPSFPTTTVTFLFTEIEGSAELRERDPAGMRAALARHNAILQRAIDAGGGDTFKDEGGAFCVAFANPAAALNTALAGQRALRSDAASAPGLPVRAAMALHTGPVEKHDEGYFGAA